ncbi:sulfatase [Knoellia sinensis KCTC 19936]|uniref:Sulfatase n=1 Tax=Knoellia sinensis KCTC 19936 TaxID=1385520 RepID=A0A0A0J450_9MICO|nr:sulfatase [Knoellia sinensis]KGN31479.1 sulfatase [Knoellia sinensis KCTC 19936]
MRAIVVMYDTLNRRYLPPYGATDVHAPNFTELAQRAVTFDNAYGGSMPCMPARREMHTGRHNFLHRAWGPLEPFDDSAPEMLKQAGVHTHLVTDHQHYWGDGGATYHMRFNTFEFVRGQEGDEWKGVVDDPKEWADEPWQEATTNHALRRQDRINREWTNTEATHPQTQVFDLGLEFIERNADADNWLVQIETFDPHEPFFAPEDFRRLYGDRGAQRDGPDLDWPDYRPVTESEDDVEHVRTLYSALLSMCDKSLGRVIEAMDRHDMWDDTMLIVCTDHGFLLGEHDWWGKNTPPYYNETIHLQMFAWDPRDRVAGERRSSLVQTIDLAPTLLDFFGLAPTPDMEGRPLREVITRDEPLRTAGLFGIFGGHVNVTDGRWVYMRAPVDPGNDGLQEFTLMPTLMRGRMPVSMLREAELVEPFRFTKGVPVLSLPGVTYSDPHAFGTMLFDLHADPLQANPVIDDETELRLATLMRDLMVANDAPTSQFVRLGLPEKDALDESHLLCRAHEGQVQGARMAFLKPEDFPTGGVPVTTSIGALRSNPATLDVLRRHLGPLADMDVPEEALAMNLLDLAVVAVGVISPAQLRAIAADLATLPEPVTADG